MYNGILFVSNALARPPGKSSESLRPRLFSETPRSKTMFIGPGSPQPIYPVTVAKESTANTVAVVLPRQGVV